jgi:hypothetical protein
MNLTLEVTSPQASALGQARRKAFGMEGGTIGRMDDNTWVLSESFVSGRHAIIHFLEGVISTRGHEPERHVPECRAHGSRAVVSDQLRRPDYDRAVRDRRARRRQQRPRTTTEARAGPAIHSS